MFYNKDRGYGRAQFDAMIASIGAVTGGRVFYVATTSQTNYNDLAGILTPDDVGVARLYGSITAALAATVSGRGDVVLIDSGYTTAPTLTELATAATNGVQMMSVGADMGTRVTAYEPPKALPQSVAGNLFAVTAKIRLIEIIGEVTTVIQSQANAIKLQAVPTVGSAVDLCGTLDINAFAVGRIVNITGTLATAMASNANGVLVGQAAPIIIPAGFIALNAAASNTGAMKWTIVYEPIDPGATVIAQ
jgi:hypothetical protein